MHILDTGPLFKFLATDCVRPLLAALGNNVIHVPEAVDFEIFDTPTRHPQFKRAAEVWPKVPDRFKKVIPDEATDELRACCRSVFGMEFEVMYETHKDRGENMAILHGVLRARAGEEVLLVCDDEAGIKTIEQQKRALAYQHMRQMHTPGGKIEHVNTLTLLYWAIERNAFETMDVFVKKYGAMAGLDSALPSNVKETGLTGRPPWPPAATTL